MPRIIFKCPYLKGGSPAVMAHLKNLVRGSEWFDHAQAVKTGGGPVAFVMYHYGLSYPAPP